MILEAIVTTLNADQSVNVSPMGPLVDASMKEFTLRPYETSMTCQNLQRTRQGVLHVTDDVELLARAAINQLDPLPEMVPATAVEGSILVAACRWYAFEVVSLDDRNERVTMQCQVVESGRQRDFFGFNRAKHAVLEAAILATRVQFLPAALIRSQLEQLAVIVGKTAGAQEQRAFDLLQDYVDNQVRNASSS
ncbi:MAG: DUF447 domain-containing protein [Pirellulaceae bacterium]|nr:DUF447 family protein [Planctomycetaceae bacterium]